jgi:hypothetical protein
VKVRIPLRSDVSADDVDNAFNDNDWAQVQAVVDDAGKPIFKRWSADAATSVHYICDGNVRVDYILVAGDGADATARQINRQLNSWSSKDIKAYAEWASAREDLVIVLHLIGLIGSDSFDPDLYRHLERGAAHQDPAVRRAAMLAASYLHWPEVAAMAHGVAANDPEHDVRVAASALLPSHLLEGA